MSSRFLKAVQPCSRLFTRWPFRTHHPWAAWIFTASYFLRF